MKLDITTHKSWLTVYVRMKIFPNDIKNIKIKINLLPFPKKKIKTFLWWKLWIVSRAWANKNYYIQFLCCLWQFSSCRTLIKYSLIIPNQKSVHLWHNVQHNIILIIPQSSAVRFLIYLSPLRWTSFSASHFTVLSIHDRFPWNESEWMSREKFKWCKFLCWLQRIIFRCATSNRLVQWLLFFSLQLPL